MYEDASTRCCGLMCNDLVVIPGKMHGRLLAIRSSDKENWKCPHWLDDVIQTQNANDVIVFRLQAGIACRSELTVVEQASRTGSCTLIFWTCRF